MTLTASFEGMFLHCSPSVLVTVVYTTPLPFCTAVGQEPRVYLTAPTYQATRYIGDAAVGSTVISIPVKVEQENKISSYLAHFGVHGFFSDNFAIGRRSGDVTIVRPVQTRSYSLQVSCYFDVTLNNGTQFQNTTRASVRVSFYGENIVHYIKYKMLVQCLYSIMYLYIYIYMDIFLALIQLYQFSNIE